MHYSLVLLWAIVSLAVAVPNPTPIAAAAATKSSPVIITDTYDDLDPGLPVSQVQNPVGIYHGLQYLGWLVGGPSPGEANSAHDGLIPQSAPNQAVGNPQLNLTLKSITVKYPGSPYRTFDLLSFYFGCTIAADNGVVSVTQNCVIAVNGFYPDGSQTGVATYAFSGANSANSPMVKANLPLKFLGVQNVTFGVGASETVPSTTNIDIDNLVHINWK